MKISTDATTTARSIEIILLIVTSSKLETLDNNYCFVLCALHLQVKYINFIDAQFFYHLNPTLLR